VIDYFTEEWNEIKADNTLGTKKHFKYTNQNLVQKHGESHASYRHTRSQRLEFEYKRGPNANAKLTGYNMRKLNQLLYTIMLVNDNDYKVECLKKLIYYNYEFMYFKGKFKDMSFVVDMHFVIESLHLSFERKKALDNHLTNPVDDLMAISLIYRDKYPFIHKYPDSLAHQVLSRLTCKSTLIDTYKTDSHKFCGLMVSRNYQIDEDIVDIFRLQNGVSAQCIHWSPNSSYIFIQSEGNYSTLVPWFAD
jgi:hypothetical protein